MSNAVPVFTENQFDDNEAVIHVNWYDAQAFCRWLSEKEDKPYRLPTEAEWEYACRAGTTTNYHTGDILSKDFYEHANITRTTIQPPVSLLTGKTAPNAWGLYDMHGNVEEWCSDWYGDYKPVPQVDPVGYADGDFKVLRGGSHSTHAYYLRSANRMGSLPETRNILTGFRVVMGELPATQGLPPPPPPLNQQDVAPHDISNLSKLNDLAVPYFRGPVPYVIIPPQASGPLYSSHNHDPAIVECPNGDILAMWYTCVSERNRELAQAASRLRWGQIQWEPASGWRDRIDR